MILFIHYFGAYLFAEFAVTSIPRTDVARSYVIIIVILFLYYEFIYFQSWNKVNVFILVSWLRTLPHALYYLIFIP